MTILTCPVVHKTKLQAPTTASSIDVLTTMFTARGALPHRSGWYPIAFADNHSTFDGLDSKFLLGFLFCLLVIVVLLLLLHLYARCLVRRNRRAATSSAATGHVILHITSTSRPKPGLDRSAIAALPTFVARRDSEEDCSVCLGVVVDGELVRLLPNCKHVFHVGCIDMWLLSHATCPVCRADVEPPASPPPTPEVCSSREDASLPKEGTSMMWWSRMLSSERQGRRGQGEEVRDIERQ